MKRLLISLLTLLFLLPLAAYAQAASSQLNAKQLAKAESLINQLEQLDVFMNSGANASQYKARTKKLYDGFVQVAAGLPESDVKTDMATAVYWYEQLSVSMNHAAANKTDATLVVEHCSNERPGVYKQLCEKTSGSARDLVWAKARLHMTWAKADVAFQRTGQVDRPLDDIAVERKLDQMLAVRLIQSLKELESKVIIYRSRGDFETSGKLARVSFETFKNDMDRVSDDAEQILSWMPQNMLKVELSNALHSFQDGAFWWEQVDQPKVVSVSNLAARNPNPSASDVALLATVPYTVAINWRQGSDYIRHAEQILN